jgi:hypothetical protein
LDESKIGQNNPQTKEGNLSANFFSLSENKADKKDHLY